MSSNQVEMGGVLKSSREGRVLKHVGKKRDIKSVEKGGTCKPNQVRKGEVLKQIGMEIICKS